MLVTSCRTSWRTHLQAPSPAGVHSNSQGIPLSPAAVVLGPDKPPQSLLWIGRKVASIVSGVEHLHHIEGGPGKLSLSSVLPTCLC